MGGSLRNRHSFLAEPLEQRIFLSSAVNREPGTAQEAVTVRWQGQQVSAAPGQWLLRVDDPAVVAGGSKRHAPAIRRPFRWSPTTLRQAVMSRRPDVRDVEMLESSAALSLIHAPPDVGYDQLVQSFGNLPGFRYLQPNFRYTIDSVPDDPRFDEQWALRNTGQTGGFAGVDVGAAEAWEQSTGEGVVVAVIDTGVDHTHPDLADNMWRNPGETPDNGRDDDGNGFVDDVFGWDYSHNEPEGSTRGSADPLDEHGHGTHVAGIIAAAANNWTGIAGVAFGAKVMALRYLNRNGEGVGSDAIKCINYITLMRQRGVNVRVMNASWGGGAYDPALADAIDAAGRAGVMFVASAGNGGDDRVGDDNDTGAHYPSNYDLPNVVSVAATNASDGRTAFSNFGARSVDLGAPGDAILSTVPFTGELSDPSGYRLARGTSMAAPHVAGAAALAFAFAPGASVAAVKDALLGGALPVPSLAGITVSGGRLSAAGALHRLASSVSYSSPGGGEHLAAPPDRYVLGFARPVNPAGLAPSDLTVNGVPADAVTLAASGLEAVFTFGQSPVTVEGAYRLRMEHGAIPRADDDALLRGYEAVFYHDAARGRIVSATPEDWATLVVGPDGRTPEITLHFSEPIDPASVGPDDLVLHGGFVPGGRVVSARATGTHTAAYALGDFPYDAEILLHTGAGAVTDVHGNPLAGSVRRVLSIDVGNTLLTPTFYQLEYSADSTGLAYHARARKVIREAGQVRRFIFDAQAGHTLAVAITPAGDIAPRVKLVCPSGEVLATGEAPAPGRIATLRVPNLAAGGTYVLVVDSANGATGSLMAEVFFNAGLEREWFGDRTRNDARDAAEDLDGQFRPLPGEGGELATVVSHGVRRTPTSPPGDDIDYFRFSLARGQRVAVVGWGGALSLEDAGGRQVASSSSQHHGAFSKGFRYAAPDAGTYYLRADSPLYDDNYDAAHNHLVVLRDADNEIENANDERETAQDVTGVPSIVGGTDFPAHYGDWYRVTLAPGDRVRLTTHTPFDGPFGLNRLDPTLTLHGPDGALFVADDNGAPDGRNATLTYTATAAGDYSFNVLPANAAAYSVRGQYVIDVDLDRNAWVAGRHVFYNNSAFDGKNPAADDWDDWAIDADKQPLLPGQAPSFANVTSYSRGINGVMVDLVGLGPTGSLDVDDFVVETAGGTAAAWAAAPAPDSVTTRRGAGAGGSDRVTLTWPDGAIRNTWLRVTVKANARTGLDSPDVFYVGNLVGETGDAASPLRVTAMDLARMRVAMFSAASIESRFDHDRDGQVTAVDYTLARSGVATALRTPTGSVPVPAAASARPPTSPAPRRTWQEQERVLL